LHSLKITLAGVRLDVTVNYPETVRFLSDYIADFSVADVTLAVSAEDISAERELCDPETPRPSDPYVETLALYRKLSLALLDFDVLLMHGSSLSLDGDGFMFTATSGTGKSTHARLWRERFGDRVTMINDDKPLIRITDGEARIYGTPWCGKHGLNTNTSAPLRSIAILERAAVNSVTRISTSEAYPTVLSQLNRPRCATAMKKTLLLLDRLTALVKFFRLRVNMEPDAPDVAYGGFMKG